MHNAVVEYGAGLTANLQLASSLSVHYVQRSAKPASPVYTLSLVLGPTAKTLAQKLSADQWAPASNM
jgi:hypothetical protein